MGMDTQDVDTQLNLYNLDGETAVFTDANPRQNTLSGPMYPPVVVTLSHATWVQMGRPVKIDVTAVKSQE